MKWWKLFFFHVFDLGLVNACLIMPKEDKNKIRVNVILEQVSEGLVASAGI